MDVKKNINTLAVLWILAILASLAWNYYGSRQEQLAQARMFARNIFDQIVLIQQWNTGHGGIYALVRTNTEPQSSHAEDEQDIVVDSTRRLRMISPALMTRQLSEMAEEVNGIKFHLSSLNPQRPGNKASSREVGFLKQFEQGIAEGGEFFEKEGASFYFYMAPLVVGKGCLTCHAEQGYQEGDVRGGISVTLPFRPKNQITIILLSHIGIGLLGLAGLFLVGRKLTVSFNHDQESGSHGRADRNTELAEFYREYPEGV